MLHISKAFCSFLLFYGDFWRHWHTKRPNNCWHQCREIANCIGSFDSNETRVFTILSSKYATANDVNGTRVKTKERCTSTWQPNATATRARAWCYSRQNHHTPAMLLSRLRDPVKNGAGIAQSVQWLGYRLNHWEIEARFPVGGRDLFSSQKSTYQAWYPQ
jgi:hypothetical protein